MNNDDTATPTAAPEQDTLDQHQLWLDAVQTAAGKAHERLPDMQVSITKAYTMVVNGEVLALGGDKYQVASGLPKGRRYWVVDRLCNCPDGATAAHGYCSHRLAALIYMRAKDLLTQHATQNAAQPQVPVEPLSQEPPPDQEQSITIPPKYIVDIQGTLAVKFAGLLYLAHERGLVTLSADWTLNDPELSLAHAIATFADGRRFEECGDASPANVTKRVQLHFRRVALTRAKARALRDALGVDLVAVEELTD